MQQTKRLDIVFQERMDEAVMRRQEMLREMNIKDNLEYKHGKMKNIPFERIVRWETRTLTDEQILEDKIKMA